MTDLPDTSPNLGLPFYQTKLNEFEVQHNEALLMLDALVMLAVKDRDLSAPPSSPALGDRYLVKATGTGEFAGKDNRIAQYDTGGWNFYAPQEGWTCYVQDEQVLIAWDGTAWQPALDVLGAITEIENLAKLGIGTTADSSNPLSAKLNNVLWTAKTVAEGGDGTLRYKLSKEDASKTLSFLFQDNFSGRAEIGLTGDDDLHIKVSADGSSWTDALTLDRTTGMVRLNSALALAGDITPPQITADQNDYAPFGLSSASVLRLSTDASRNLTGLSGGADGRVAAIVNVGSNNLILKDASTSSSAANRFAFGADVTLAAKQSAVLLYDLTDSRWKLLAGPQASSGSVPSDLDITLAELSLGMADATNVAQFLGGAGNRFADSFDALTYVNAGAATNLDTGTAGLLKPSTSADIYTSTSDPSLTSNSSGFGGEMIRQVFAAAGLSTNGDKVRVTFTPPTSGNNTTISNAYIGKKGATAPNFDGGQVRITFNGGSNGVTLTAGGASVMSDAIAFSFDHTVDHVIALEMTGTSDVRLNAGSASNVTRYEKTGSGESGTTSVSGYASNAGYLLAIDKIEVRTATGSTNNLTVQSTGLASAAAPTSIKITALVNHVDSAAAGTDYKFKVSRDGGSHLSGYLTLNSRFTVPSGSLHVIESDVIDVTSITSGAAPLWRFETLTNKMVELQGVYLYWT